MCEFIFKKLKSSDCVNCIEISIWQNIEPVHIFASFREYKDSISLNYINKVIIFSVEIMPNIKQNIITALDCVHFGFLNKYSKHK